MIDHDLETSVRVLDALDELGLAEDTIVLYSTDNGPAPQYSGQTAGTTPFRSEKDTNWEGAFRVPELIRWPGKIEAGTVSNEIVQHHDWLPTLLAAAGDPDVSEKLKKGFKAGADGNTGYKVHIDGFNLLPYLTGEVDTSPRRGLFYFSDDVRSGCDAVRELEGRVQWSSAARARSGSGLNHSRRYASPKLFNLRTDPSRVRRHHLEHVLRMVAAARLLHLLCHRYGDKVPGNLQGIPAPARAGQLQRRPGRWPSCTTS